MKHDVSRPEDDLMPAKVIYGLYAVGYFTAITSVAGIIYAYLSRGKSADLDSHLRFQIRTFWISLLLAFLGMLTMMIGIGFLIWAFLTVWGLTRVISGFLLANENRPVSGTKYWGIIAY